MIAIVDYGMGNLRSVEKAFEHLGVESIVTQNSREVAKADKVVLPGVGAFGDCIANLKSYELYDGVIEAAQSGKPFLGICLGLQALFDESEEGGKHLGLGLISGKVVRFNIGLKVPHMGWNQIFFLDQKQCPLLKGVEQGSFVYFVHSYYGVPTDDKVTVCQTDYGTKFSSMIWKDNVFATQFHPEKSQSTGLRILKNFAALKI